MAIPNFGFPISIIADVNVYAFSAACTADDGRAFWDLSPDNQDCSGCQLASEFWTPDPSANSNRGQAIIERQWVLAEGDDDRLLARQHDGAWLLGTGGEIGDGATTDIASSGASGG